MTQHLQTMMCEYTILIIMLYIGVRCLNQRNNKIIRSFSHFVFGVIAFQIINIPVRMVDAGLVRMPAAVVFVLNCGFMIAETFVTYEWFYFFESIQNSLFVEKKIIRALRSIPLVLMIVLCVVSWWTGWLFYVDDTGMYRRGALFALQVVLPYTYVFVTLVSAIVYSITMKREKICRHHNYSTHTCAYMFSVADCCGWFLCSGWTDAFGDVRVYRALHGGY